MSRYKSWSEIPHLSILKAYIDILTVGKALIGKNVHLTFTVRFLFKPLFHNRSFPAPTGYVKTRGAIRAYLVWFFQKNFFVLSTLVKAIYDFSDS